MLDAACAPIDIAYPTDLKLLNEGREKLKSIIDTLHASRRKSTAKSELIVRKRGRSISPYRNNVDQEQRKYRRAFSNSWAVFTAISSMRQSLCKKQRFRILATNNIETFSDSEIVTPA